MRGRLAGTSIFGQPALISVVIGADGILEAILIETDPAAPWRVRQRAFLVGQRAKHRFCAETWSCGNREPSAGEEPVGRTFIKERCINRMPDRVVKIDIDLYRPPG